MDFERAVHFAKTHGDELQRYRVDFHFNDIRDDEIPLNYYRRRQEAKGGFPYDLEPGNLISTNETTGILGMLAELDLSKSDVAKKAIDYILSIQSRDGSWDEGQEIKELNPLPWDKPGELNTRLWLTALTAANLVNLEKGDLEAVMRAADFLLQHRDESGRFQGLHNHDLDLHPPLLLSEGKGWRYRERLSGACGGMGRRGN